MSFETMSKLHASYSDPSTFGSASVVPQPALPLYGTPGQQSAQYGQQQPIQQQPSLYVPFPAQVTIQTMAVPAKVETRMAQFMFPYHPSANINPVRHVHLVDKK
ncbi:uncharacterized protein LOC143062480 [Mytilus galloprovincialis]|uniref:uncharacterized protein LOC143062480 n=1 Tax=Mytilus galloprovincialis TaxID=29158 RepID=UPI003F7BE017